MIKHNLYHEVESRQPTYEQKQFLQTPWHFCSVSKAVLICTVRIVIVFLSYLGISGWRRQHRFGQSAYARQPRRQDEKSIIFYCLGITSDNCVVKIKNLLCKAETRRARLSRRDVIISRHSMQLQILMAPKKNSIPRHPRWIWVALIVRTSNGVFNA